MRRVAGLLSICVVSVSLPGCAYNLRGTEQENLELRLRHDRVLDKFFNKSAAEALKKITVHYAELPEFAAGASTHSTLATMWEGWGYEPKTIYNIKRKETISDAVIVHEATHHAETQGLVDKEEFLAAWEVMRRQKHFAYLMANTTVSLNYGGLPLLNLLSFGEDSVISEHIAYMTAYILKTPLNFGESQPLPESMKQVYRKLFKAEIFQKEDDPVAEKK